MQHTLKNLISVFLILFVALGISCTQKAQNTEKNTKNTIKNPSSTSSTNTHKSEGEWIVKINGKNYSKNDLDDEYYFFWENLGIDKNLLKKIKEQPENINRLNPPEVRPFVFESRYLDKFIQNQLVYQKAKSSGFLDNPKIKKKLEIAMRFLVTEMYLKEILKDKIHISDDEVISFIEEQQKKNPKFGEGLSPEELKKRTKLLLMRIKLQQEGEAFVKKLVEEAKIERNEKLLQKLEDMEMKALEKQKPKSKHK
jgi:hypothetical protein